MDSVVSMGPMALEPTWWDRRRQVRALRKRAQAERVLSALLAQRLWTDDAGECGGLWDEPALAYVMAADDVFEVYGRRGARVGLYDGRGLRDGDGDCVLSLR